MPPFEVPKAQHVLCQQTCKQNRVMEKSGSKVVIHPKSKALSPSELISLRNVEVGPIRNGLKKTKPSGTADEAAELARVYDELQKQLSVPRIDRLAGRSEGEWDPDRKAVKVLRKEGKFNVFGYSLNGEHYLEDHEALFLLELNRIDISYYSIRMSIEQGYLLFLGEKESIKYKNYLVYSLFSRIGYIVQRHQNLSFSEKPPDIEDCIWSILLNSVQNKPIPDKVRNSEYYAEVERAMDDIRNKIINQEEIQPLDDTEDEVISFGKKIQPTKKRKAEESVYNAPKRPRCDYVSPTEQKSFIDMLTKEEDYKKFENLFQSFDIIKLKPQFEYENTNDDVLEIQFDIHFHNDHFKKSEPKPPAFRVAVLDRNQRFPNRSVISKCYYKQEYRVPVLVVSVSESKHIQGFLYYFT